VNTPSGVYIDLMETVMEKLMDELRNEAPVLQKRCIQLLQMRIISTVFHQFFMHNLAVRDRSPVLKMQFRSNKLK
jgi:hypothetical protein